MQTTAASTTAYAPRAYPKMETPDPDAELVQRAQHGDEQAYRGLFEQHAPRIQRVVARYLKDSDDTADVVQEVFSRAFRALHKFDGRSRFSTWLHRIAINESIHRLRALKTERLLIDRRDDVENADRGATPARTDDTPETILASKQVARSIELAVASLSFNHRQALEMRELEGLSYAVISDRLGIPMGTVRTRIFRGRDAVAAALLPVRLSSSASRF